MFPRQLSSVGTAMLSIALAIGTTLATPSFANPMDAAQPQLTINYDDLDVSTTSGAAKLYRRLQSASRAVCSTLKGFDIASTRRYDDCRAKALADAVHNVGEQTLSSLHARTSSYKPESHRKS